MFVCTRAELYSNDLCIHVYNLTEGDTIRITTGIKTKIYQTFIQTLFHAYIHTGNLKQYIHCLFSIQKCEERGKFSFEIFVALCWEYIFSTGFSIYFALLFFFSYYFVMFQKEAGRRMETLKIWAWTIAIPSFRMVNAFCCIHNNIQCLVRISCLQNT